MYYADKERFPIKLKYDDNYRNITSILAIIISIFMEDELFPNLHIINLLAISIWVSFIFSTPVPIILRILANFKTQIFKPHLPNYHKRWQIFSTFCSQTYVWGNWYGCIFFYLIISQFYVSSLKNQNVHIDLLILLIFLILITILEFFSKDKAFQFFYKNHRRAYVFNFNNHLIYMLKYFIITPTFLILIYYYRDFILIKYNIFSHDFFNFGIISGWWVYIINFFMSLSLFHYSRRFLYLFLTDKYFIYREYEELMMPEGIPPISDQMVKDEEQIEPYFLEDGNNKNPRI